MEINNRNNSVQSQQPRPYYQTQQQPTQNSYRPQQYQQAPAAYKKGDKNKVREPLSNQSKGILFGLLGGFFLFGAVVFWVLTFII